MSDIPLPSGLSMRPQRDTDAPFMASLYHSRRDDLRLIDGEDDFIEDLIDMQFNAQNEGYGQRFPNAMYFVVESHGKPIGRVAVDFGHNEVRLIDIALIREARGKGYGAAIIRSVQAAANKTRTPLTLTVALDNPQAFRLYAGLGFAVEQKSQTHALMIWHPQPL